MKYTALLALVALAGSASAGISVAERFILANIGSTPTIPSVGLSGNPANVVFFAQFNGVQSPASPAPGQPYILRTIELTGSLSAINGGSFAREAVIRVQPPNNAQAFYIQPFLQASVNATSLPIFNVHATVPLVQSNPQGVWTFTFEETFDDVTGTGVDAVWQTAIISFSEVATDLPAADPEGSFPLNLGTFASNGTSAAPGDSGSFGLTNEQGTFNALRITGQVTTAINGTTNSFEPQSSDVRLRFTPPGGGAPFTVAPVITGTNALSTATVDLTVPYFGQQFGTWVLEAFESTDTPGGVDNIWNNLRLQLVTTPPPANAFNLADFIGLSPSTPEITSFLTTSGFVPVQWYTFTTTVDISQASGYYLDLDTVGTVRGSAVTDTELAIFDSRGVLITEDDDGGPGAWSQLSFGSNVARPALPAQPPATSVGDPRNGIDGNLPLGIYYVASTDFNATFGSPYLVTPPTFVPSTLRIINVRTNLSTGSFCGTADLGGEGGAEGFDNFLDNNDFIVFINLFFANDARADLGSEGGAEGSDDLWDNNDFIVFIQAFFAGQSNPGCNEPS